MTTSPYIRPRVGRRTVAAIALACLVFGLLVVRLRLRPPISVPIDFAASVGIVYGLASGGWFLASALVRRWVRVVSRGLTLLAAAMLMATTQRWALEIPPEPRRYLLFLGGMVVVQTAFAPLIGLPRWGRAGRFGEEGAGGERDATGRAGAERGATGRAGAGRAGAGRAGAGRAGAGRAGAGRAGAGRAGAGRAGAGQGKSGSGRQYRIGDLLVSTTALAVLFAVGGHYSTPVEARFFWAVLMACWFLLPVVATFAMACSLRRGWRSGAVFGLVSLLTAGVATGGLAQAEQAVERGGGPATAELLTLYGALIGAYAVVVFCIGVAGRFDARVGGV